MLACHVIIMIFENIVIVWKKLSGDELLHMNFVRMPEGCGHED